MNLSGLPGRIRRAVAGALRRWAAAQFEDPEGAAALIRRLVAETARQYAWRYAAALTFMVVGALAAGAAAWIMRDLINGVFIERRGDLVVPIALTVLVVFSVRGAANYAQTVILSQVGAAIVADVQRRIVHALLQQGMDFYDTAETGELTTRMSHNAEAARTLIGTLATSVGRDFFTVLVLVAVMVVQDPLMAFLSLVVAPPAIVAIAALVRRVKKLARQAFVSQTQIVQAMNETIRGMRVVKAFGLEEVRRDVLGRAIGEVEQRNVRIARLNALSSPLTETLGGASVAVVILYGGYSVITLGGDPGGFFAFMTAFLLAYEPAKRLARVRVHIQQQLVGVRLLYELLDREPSLADVPDARPLRVEAGGVTLEDVHFAYRGRPALHGVTMRAEPGRVTALVGPSGSGKSTVFNLIARFYDRDAGLVAIDGQDVARVTQASLRDALALVTQDTFLFSATIRENILYGRPGATDAEWRSAAEAANVASFAEALPDGYETQVGEGGGRLSGGQRQRVAIARAMLRDAPILLLDEATSALDAESEIRVQEALERLMRGRTTLVIAHRLATIRGADCIHVMRDGRVVESGTHAALIAREGLYKHLHALQFSPSAA
jgi:ATP-binding cassette subfamily B protein